MGSPKTNDTLSSTISPKNMQKTDSTPYKERKKLIDHYMDETVKNDISLISNKQFYHDILIDLENITFNDHEGGILIL